jgi:hypothetical protein
MLVLLLLRAAAQQLFAHMSAFVFHVGVCLIFIFLV